MYFNRTYIFVICPFMQACTLTVYCMHCCYSETHRSHNPYDVPGNPLYGHMPPAITSRMNQDSDILIDET